MREFESEKENNKIKIKLVMKFSMVRHCSFTLDSKYTSIH